MCVCVCVGGRGIDCKIQNKSHANLLRVEVSLMLIVELEVTVPSDSWLYVWHATESLAVVQHQPHEVVPLITTSN